MAVILSGPGLLLWLLGHGRLSQNVFRLRLDCHKAAYVHQRHGNNELIHFEL